MNEKLSYVYEQRDERQVLQGHRQGSGDHRRGDEKGGEMSENTHADIIAEMRKTKYGDEECKVKWCLIPWADDLDAAHRREVNALNEQIADLHQQRDLWSRRAAELVEKCNEQYAKLKQVGNAAKVREALSAALDMIFDLQVRNRSPIANSVYAVRRKIKDALAAPPRNCDALSVQEQTEKFNQFCQSHRNSDLPKCAGCPLEDIPDGTGCAQAWAQLPYVAKEGGAK